MSGAGSATRAEEAAGATGAAAAGAAALTGVLAFAQPNANEQTSDARWRLILTRATGGRSPSWYHAAPLHAAFASLRALIALLGLGVGACGAAQPSTPIGMSDAAPEPAPPPSALAPPRATGPDLAAARAWPEAAPPAIALVHRRDGTLIHVRVEPAFLPAYQQLSAESPMPDGARLVAWHVSPSGALLDGYVLEKRANLWSARVINAQGAPVHDDPPRCLRCHEMAPTDHLFGRPSASPAGPPSPPAVH